METYKLFANYYDELMQDVNYEEWFEYTEEIFSRFNKKPKTILEMACGTGNLTYYLCKNGYNVTCFDVSSDMLAIAYNKLFKFKNVNVLSQNMVDFNIYEKFDAVLSICDSINYITNKNDLYKTFVNVHNHLNDKGVFIFDINSYYKLKNIIGNNTFVDENDNLFYAWQNEFDEEKNLSNFYLTFFIKNKDNKYIRFDEEHVERAYTVLEVKELLKEANFNDIVCYEDFTFNKPRDKSERIHFIAHK